ncbi:MAG: hypothetical protein GAK33_05849 [Burkholderia lata]|uniref:Uncharacterized protein n=2 Tax=Burkholderia lata (strain ATCC 17760 / DSM 23089 / LMG 22485 / NCIMB 9086 / R18194 / 383) TaxID=482957 RepID=A0A833PP15_BURL3|nr:MAG: hypothetical protein GAK33_05849 [Burkholderia lata]
MKLDAKWLTKMPTFSHAQTTIRQKLHALTLKKGECAACWRSVEEGGDSTVERCTTEARCGV